MKVTKRVEEIISSRVREKFDLKYQATKSAYANQVDAELAAVERMNEEVVDFLETTIRKKYGHIFKDFDSTVKQVERDLPSRRYARTATDIKLGEIHRAIAEKAKKETENIILALEMGGTLETLDEMLSKIDTTVEMEEE